MHAVRREAAARGVGLWPRPRFRPGQGGSLSDMTRIKAPLGRLLLPLLALAVAAGLASAQNATSTATQTKAKATASDPVVIQLGSQTETLSDFESRFEIAMRSLAAQQGVPFTPQVMQQLQQYQGRYLQLRATQMVLLATAKSQGLTVDQKHVDTVMSQVQSKVPKGQNLDALLKQAGYQGQAQLKELVAESDLINQEVQKLQNAIPVTDAELQTYYKAHLKDYSTPEQVCARHILLKTEADAKAVMKDLANGADFATEAKAKSVGPSAPQGGDLGCFGRGQMVKAFEDAAFNAPVGKVVGPVKTQYGYHVILVSKHSKASTKTFSEAKSAVEKAYRQAQTDQKVQAMVKASGIKTFPDLLPSPPAPAAPPANGGGATGTPPANGGTTTPPAGGGAPTGAN